MKKQIVNLGKALDKANQKQINGGESEKNQCEKRTHCTWYSCITSCICGQHFPPPCF